MRIRLLVLAGLIVAAMAPENVRQASAQSRSPEPYYVNGQPFMSDPAQQDRGPEEQAARTAHRAALDGVYAAFGYPWPAMCTPERHAALVAALNAYYGDRIRFERHGGWFSPDKWKNSAFNWQTLDDKAVERLTRLAFVNRYFVISELDPRVANAVRELVRGKQSQARCAEDFEPWPAHYTHQQFLQADREGYRGEALEQLKAPWARTRSCDRGARKLLIWALERYYQERVRQHEGLMDWGTLGMRRAIALWSTEGDRTIDDLVRTMLQEGYLSLDDIRKARPLVASLLDSPVGAPRCPEQAARAR
jgi:hypothetical protein